MNYGTKLDPVSFDGEETQFADSGMGRSSSEEKDSAAPAQSKRKAQNRAAYVISVPVVPNASFGYLRFI